MVLAGRMVLPVVSPCLVVVAAPLQAQLGSVTELPSDCPGGIGNLTATTCRLLRVDVPGLPSIEVEVRITEPAPAVPFRGTAVFGSGGWGTEFYAELPGGELMLQQATQSGFRVVDRSWASGWFATQGATFTLQSARFATLLEWIHAEIHAGGAFVACGNSGGAGEIGYALTTWGMDGLLDVAILSSGPPMTRLDFLCEDPASPAWAALCPTLVPPGTLVCGSASCTPAAGNLVCPLLPTNLSPGALLEDSILHSGADLDYPNTLVYGLFGTLDCSNAVPLGLLFMNSVTSQKVVAWAADTPHELMSTEQGRAAILGSLSCGATLCTAVTYCTAGTSASGCQAALVATGHSSASATSGFVLTATSVEGLKDGLFFFGTSGGQAAPWGNGTSYQCVVPPVKRTGPLTATGTLGACDGLFSQDLNAYWCSTCPAAQKNPGPGVLAQAQLWYRDPASTSNQTTSLSNAVEFCVGP